MIDSHCHLNFPIIKDNIKKIISNAIENKITSILSINTEPDNFIDHLKLIENYKSVYIAYGLHPLNVNNQTKFEINNILNNIKNDKVIGIGETGLDYYYNHSDKKIQKKSFEEHIHAASQLNVPVIVHSRNAETDTYETLKNLKKNSNLKILIHCFTGSKSFAKKLLDLNCYISISGIITFKKSTELVDAVSYIPIEKLLVETDSPYLSPEPYRGKANEPSHVKYVVEKLALIKNIPVNSVIENTSKNFLSIFNIN